VSSPTTSRRNSRTAIQAAQARQNAYKCKNLNIWDQRAQPVDEHDCLEGLRGSFSLDGGVPAVSLLPGALTWDARIDLTSRCRLFVKWQGDQRHYYAFGTHYVPRDRANDGEHQPLRALDQRHRIVDHEGAEIQLAFVQKEIEAELPQFSDRGSGLRPTPGHADAGKS